MTIAQALNAQMLVAEKIKARFPNLTVNEVNALAKDVVMAVMTVTV